MIKVWFPKFIKVCQGMSRAVDSGYEKEEEWEEESDGSGRERKHSGRRRRLARFSSRYPAGTSRIERKRERGARASAISFADCRYRATPFQNISFRNAPSSGWITNLSITSTVLGDTTPQFQELSNRRRDVSGSRDESFFPIDKAFLFIILKKRIF